MQNIEIGGDLRAWKVNAAIDRIKLLTEAERQRHPKLYFAFSGGKDSVVVYHLLKKAGVPFESFYSCTSVDPPELIQFIRREYPDVRFIYPGITMWNLIPSKLMPPTRKVRYCCEVLKEYGGRNRQVITGIRAAESSKRKKRRMIENCTSKKKSYLHPIFDFEESDVWDFIFVNKVKYCSLYDEGFTRLGCIGCPMGGGRTMWKEFKKWPLYYAAYLRSFSRMLKERKRRGLVTTWKTPEDVFNWWLWGDKDITDYSCPKEFELKPDLATEQYGKQLKDRGGWVGAPQKK